jgi:uncharacterized membrane protein YcaP (DUF421 family)
LDKFFFDDWMSLARTLVIVVLAYVALVAFVRISGKRTLAKMNAFDWVVTVALGSTLATVLLNKDVALAEGALGFAVLIGMQFIVAWSSVRSKMVQKLVKSEPALLYYDGKFLEEAMRRERVVLGEIYAAVRSEGFAGLGDVEAVVLETEGKFSVLARSKATPPSAMQRLEAP